MNTSLSKFCKDYSLPKSNVHRRCQELSLDTSQGLDENAIATLLHEFDCVPSLPDETEQPATAVHATVDAGNHFMVLSTPQLPQTYSLEGLRQGDAMGFEDPLALAAKFLQDADMVQIAMQQDIQQRQQRLQATQQAKDVIAAKTQQLQLEARLYSMQAGNLDTALTSETQALTDSMQQLSRMGKPTDGGSLQA